MEWMSLRQERRKNDATCVEQMVTLIRSALKCKKIMMVLRLDLLEIPPMDCLRILLCVHMYLNQMYGYVFRPVCDNYISLCIDMYLHQIVACNITKVFV